LIKESLPLREKTISIKTFLLNNENIAEFEEHKE
jgi:hypothetical protein